ncbi:type VI secretion system protein TssA [Serpens gallinarum]|uniref:Type VI secretion system protein TssA n=1 Tax=Serpens gallinarum TaxID=2763075 RepID=A0ABR8TII8_9PSED|nr:type VI secretion system protein TssA [Serpens gallinarum]MBD7975586.1 type VI secretion system protein TssA [Serpens gallinarum]
MTYSSALHSHYVQLANLPIRPDNFAGDDARYSSEYEYLERQLQNASSIHADGAVDWPHMLDACAALLASQSKDLRVAAWLTWGLLQQEALPGLHAGLGILRHLCVHHWDDLHPRKPRTRAAALNWLVPRLEQALNEELPPGEQPALLQSLAEHLRDLDACLSQHLADDAPLLLPLSRRLTDLLNTTRQSPAVAPAETPTVATAQSITPSAPAAPGVVHNDKDAHKCLRQLQDQARPLCAWWLARQAGDVRALRLSRTLLWLPIDSVPEHNAEQITALRGLPVDKLVQFQERFQQGRHTELLVELEASLARAPFWLDGQHRVWECLHALDATPALQEVEIQLALFLQRIPGLDELRFHDGTPFASEATRAWISARVMPHVQAPQAAPASSPPPADGAAPWETALQEVLPLLRKEGLKPAVRQLSQGLASARGGRETFFWQLALARLCHQAKQYELAKVQLETLDQKLQASGLDAWEPNLALDILHLLYACYERLQQHAGVRERKDEIYRRLCHLDLGAALE